MNKELKLQIPNSLYQSLSESADRQGVSIEALCISMLEPKQSFIEPELYSSLSTQDVRNEIQRLLQSSLPKPELNSRVRRLNSQITRFIR
jgi:hypothetical protein